MKVTSADEGTSWKLSCDSPKKVKTVKRSAGSPVPRTATLTLLSKPSCAWLSGKSTEPVPPRLTSSTPVRTTA
ncbi:MAG: hypothetical protein HYU66_00705 [Armatimonadetes bacterium]|nr:hypothetical protein [Armatimonadota bacterium]